MGCNLKFLFPLFISHPSNSFRYQTMSTAKTSGRNEDMSSAHESSSSGITDGMRERAGHSNVWEYYKKRGQPDPSTCLCRSKLLAKLWHPIFHVYFAHAPLRPLFSFNYNQKYFLSNGSLNSILLKPHLGQQKEFFSSLCHQIIDAWLPFSSIDNDRFRELISFFDSTLLVPYVTTVTRIILNLLTKNSKDLRPFSFNYNVWEKAFVISKFLESSVSLTECQSGYSYATLSATVKEFKSLLQKCDMFVDVNYSTLTQIAQKMRTKLEKYDYVLCEELTKLVQILDPRFGCYFLTDTAKLRYFFVLPAASNSCKCTSISLTEHAGSSATNFMEDVLDEHSRQDPFDDEVVFFYVRLQQGTVTRIRSNGGRPTKNITRTSLSSPETCQ